MLGIKFLGYLVLETVMLSLTMVQVNMRAVGSGWSCVSMQLLSIKFLGYLVLETVMWSLTMMQVNLRDVGRV